jgi:hypothetical protein
VQNSVVAHRARVASLRAECKAAQTACFRQRVESQAVSRETARRLDATPTTAPNQITRPSPTQQASVGQYPVLIEEGAKSQKLRKVASHEVAVNSPLTVEVLGHSVWCRLRQSGGPRSRLWVGRSEPQQRQAYRTKAGMLAATHSARLVPHRPGRRIACTVERAAHIQWPGAIVFHPKARL